MTAAAERGTAGGGPVVITAVRAVRQPAPDAEPLPAALDLVRNVEDEAAGLWADAGLGDGQTARAGAVLGSCYGTGHVNEYMCAVLAARPVPRFHPDAFLYHAASAVAGSVCQRLRLGGAGAVVLGPGGMTDAVIAASRSVLAGRHDAVVAGGFERPSARASALLAGAGVDDAGDPDLRIVLLLLESAAHASARGARVRARARLRPGFGEPATARLDEVAGALSARAPCDAVVRGDGPSALRIASPDGDRR